LPFELKLYPENNLPKEMKPLEGKTGEFN